jgi:hypothetical protein
MKARGFEESTVSVTFDITGEYKERTQLTEDSDDKYPTYFIDYRDSGGNLWYVYINNGNYVARPMFGGEGTTIPLVVTETDYITGYDGSTNTFTNTVPKAEEMTIKKVSSVDAPTLDVLAEELSGDPDTEKDKE